MNRQGTTVLLDQDVRLRLDRIREARAMGRELPSLGSTVRMLVDRALTDTERELGIDSD